MASGVQLSFHYQLQLIRASSLRFRILPSPANLVSNVFRTLCDLGTIPLRNHPTQSPAPAIPQPTPNQESPPCGTGLHAISQSAQPLAARNQEAATRFVDKPLASSLQGRTSDIHPSSLPFQLLQSLLQQANSSLGKEAGVACPARGEPDSINCLDGTFMP